jgi:sterol desaturase/sphingolipid hydroxylase (fatty acid hydroxylase superfamily)
MDLLASGMIELRLSLFLGLAVLLLALEWVVPFRAPVQSKLHHVSTNLVILGVNALALQLLVGWAMLLWSSHVDSEAWGLLHQLQLEPISHVFLSVILLDLIYYGAHRLNHLVPFLWRFHRAHHSDLDVDMTTSGRFHLGEAVITTGIKGVSVLALGVSPVGFLVSETALLAAGQFQHSNLRLPARLERWLRFVIVTPPMHWIHHSRRSSEHNTNYGTMISAWDRWFGTYFMGDQQSQITVGLDEYPKPEDVNILRFYRIPFGPACRRIR